MIIPRSLSSSPQSKVLFLKVLVVPESVTCCSNKFYSSTTLLQKGYLRTLRLIIIIIIIPGQLIKRRKWWFGPPHQGLFDILTMMGRECIMLDPTYWRHITFACTGCYQLHSHHRLRHYYPRLIAGTNLPTWKG